MLSKAEAIKRLIAEAEDAANVLDAQYYYDHASDLREAIANFRAAMVREPEGEEG